MVVQMFLYCELCVVKYLAIATAHILKEAARGEQPAAGGVTGAAAFLLNSIDAINRDIYHSPPPVRHHLAKPQKLDAAVQQARRLHP